MEETGARKSVQINKYKKVSWEAISKSCHFAKTQTTHLNVGAVHKAVCEYLFVVAVGGASNAEVGYGGIGSQGRH